jgi:hypothetical protein
MYVRRNSFTRLYVVIVEISCYGTGGWDIHSTCLRRRQVTDSCHPHQLVFTSEPYAPTLYVRTLTHPSTVSLDIIGVMHLWITMHQ